MMIQEATGTNLRKKDLLKEKLYDVTRYGSFSDKNPVQNTKIINTAIHDASKNGGGCVFFPKGEYKTYTIELKSNVNLYLEDGAVIKAARTDILHSYEKQKGEGGNYKEPEVNLYAGLQDHGHSYFANSLFYACDQENIMIYGQGKIDGSYIDEETGFLRYTLMGGDPLEPEYRTDKGYQDEWFGNKGIALVRCKNVVLADFSFVIGGHFAIICEGVDNLYVENILVDTTRDAFDIDCCQNVTVVNSTFNSLTDDALVVKASYGAGVCMPAKNILIEDCVVSGYDAGSVYAGVYSREKLVATDLCGPTGRVKLGTESTCGYERVTVRRVKFDRSRGFALEAVDGSDLTDIIFEDIQMDNISSSPVFLRVGDRGRFPVTGLSKDQYIVPTADDIRIDQKNWILPSTEEFTKYPVKRYVPSYLYNQAVSIDGKSSFKIVDQAEPVRINHLNQKIVQCNKNEAKYYGNACGADHIAHMSHILIKNVVATNVDPRYPIIIMGLMDSKIEDICIENVKVTYRGGLKMEHAVEQRQLFTNWEYEQYLTSGEVQTLPWLVNPFFSKNESLLPRMEWDSKKQDFKESPYNIPELPNVYPEPSNWGILPAFGMYIRHAQNVKLKHIELNTMVFDERDLLVLDDVCDVTITDLSTNQGNRITTVENRYKRKTNKEYVKDEPYIQTSVQNVTLVNCGLENDLQKIKHVIVDCPAPGTPKDSLYQYPTVAVPENGYHYKIKTEEYKLPFTVYRPFFSLPRNMEIAKGDLIQLEVKLRDPSSQTTRKQAGAFIYNEKKQNLEAVVFRNKRDISIRISEEHKAVRWLEKSRMLEIDASKIDTSQMELTFVADDGIIEERQKIYIKITNN